MNMCKGVIFDMDGVLIDSHPVHKKAWEQFLASVGRPVSQETLDFVLDGRKREEILRYYLGDLTPDQIVEYGRRKDELFKDSARDMQTIPGVLEFLEMLESSGVSMAVATSASSGRAHDVLMRLGILPRFEAIVTGNDVRKGKPDPEIFLLAADRMKQTPRNLLVVEDAVSGVKAAKSAGMKCLGIAADGRREKLEKAGADCIIPDFTKISLLQVQRFF